MKLVTLSALVGSTAAFPALLNLGGKGSLVNLNGKGGLLDLGSTGDLIDLSGNGALLNLTVLELNAKEASKNTYPAADPKNCPYNPNHVPAAAWDPKFPYNYAKNGLPGKGKGGYQVPAPGDEAHKFIAPGPNDIRGPCPGMNMFANHGFIARDGVTSLEEVVDASQNVFNMAWDLANVISLVALVLGDGDIISRKFSIGCDATSRTAAVPLIAGSQPGLNGHNNFEADASMGRDDYFLNEGNNYSLNGTKFGMMVAATEGKFNISGLSRYRYQRWHQSAAENPNGTKSQKLNLPLFFFGPAGLLLYGDAAFLPELYADGQKNYVPDVETISTFFGAHLKADGTWVYGHNETIPKGYINRVRAYGLVDEVNAIVSMYSQNPVLFGGNTAPGKFDTLDFAAIKDGKLRAGVNASEVLCFIFQLLTAPSPGVLNGVASLATGTLELVLSTVGDVFTNLGCPAPLNGA